MNTPVIILTSGSHKDESLPFEIKEGECVVVSVFTTSGADLPTGIVLQVMVKDIFGEFQELSTLEYGNIQFSSSIQQLSLKSPGVYKISRTDISTWNMSVGVEIYTYTIIT